MVVSLMTNKGEPYRSIKSFTEIPLIYFTGVYSVLLPNLLSKPAFSF